MTEVKRVEEDGEPVIASMDELKEMDKVEYATILGFLPGKTLRIGSLTAGDLIEWTEANEGEAKRTAGLRLITKSLVGPEPDNVRYADNVKNIAVFRNKQHKATEKIVEAILNLNGMTVKKDAKSKND